MKTHPGFYRPALLVLAIALASCATIGKNTDTSGSTVKSADKTATGTLVKIGELTVELVEKPIDYVRGQLLYNDTDAAGRTVLHYAVADNNTEEVTRLLDEGAPRKYGRDGYEPYHLAILGNHDKLLQIFASYHQDLKKPTAGNLPPLHLAAKNDAAKSLAWLLKAGQDPLQKGPAGHDAIQTGIANNRSEFLVPMAEYIDLGKSDASGDTYMHYAVTNRNKSALVRLLGLGVEPNLTNRAGDTPLLVAVGQSRSEELINELIHNNADTEKPDTTGDTPLLKSVRGNYPQNLALLVNARANANARDASGNSAVFLAVQTNNGDHIPHLARAGVNLDQYNSKGFTPIQYAVVLNLPRTIDPLVQNGAMVDARVRDKGVTALMLAARLGHNRSQAALFKLGASYQLRDIAGNTALHYAAGFNQPSNLDAALEDGAELNAQNGRGETPLHTSIYHNASRSFSRLLQKKPDVTIRDLRDNQPLHATLYTANLVFARDLIKQHAPINSPNARGQTPLIAMIDANNLEMVKLLIDEGASLTLPTARQRLPIHQAAVFDRPEAIILLVRGGSQINPSDVNGHTPLHLAALAGNFVSIRALVRNGAYLDMRDPHLRTPLHLAARANQPGALKELIQAGADPGLHDDALHTPIFTALDANAIDSFAPLLRTSNPNLRDPQGNTALLKAMQQGKLKAARRLLQLGVSPQRGNMQGLTPITVAFRQSNPELISQLANQGADISTPLAKDGDDLCGIQAGDSTASTKKALEHLPTTATPKAAVLTQTPQAEPKTQSDAVKTPGPMQRWASDCQLFLNDSTYLGKRLRWVLLGKSSGYVASRWWRRIPLPPLQNPDKLEAAVRDSRAKLAYYLSYSLPNQYLPPLNPPRPPKYDFSQQSNETDTAYLERLDYYEREYQMPYKRALANYTQRKENRLERIAQLSQYHQQLDVAPKRPAISFSADALQHHFQRPLYASNGAVIPGEKVFVLEIPLGDAREPLLVKIKQRDFPEHFAFIQSKWRYLPWYLGAEISPDSVSFVELATMGPDGALFIPLLESDDPTSLKVLINKFNRF